MCVFLKLANLLPASWSVRMPLISMDPPSCLLRVPRICSSVVLPAPEAPTIDTTSPASILRLIPFNTCRFPKDLVMFEALIMLLK